MRAAPIGTKARRSLAWIGTATLLVLPLSLLASTTDKEQQRAKRSRHEGQIDGRPVAAVRAELQLIEKNRRQFFPRPRATWWPAADEAGLKPIGQLGWDRVDPDHTLVLPNNKGLVDVRELDALREIPPSVKGNPDAPGLRKGKGPYYLIQLAPGAVEGMDSLQIREELLALGIEPIDYVPHNGYLARVSPQGRDALEDRDVFQFSEYYGPYLKVHPSTGRRSLRDERRAVSDDLDVVLRVMPGETSEAIVDTVTRVGGEIVHVHRDIAGQDYVSARVRNTRLVEVLEDPAVMSAFESPEYMQMNLTTSAQVEVGRFLDPRTAGDFLLPYRSAGVDGGGIYGGVLPNYTNPAPGAALVLDPNAFVVRPQFLGVADNGLTLDSPAFANDNTHPCLTGACGTGLGGVTGLGPTHRKVEAYTTGSDVDNNAVINDPTASGDFLTCDSIRSGGRTHGTVSAGAAAANPSGGPLGLGRLFEDSDVLDQFFGFFNDSREANLPLDGQARGARVIFQDIAITPASSPPACAVNFLSDVDAGDVPAARLQDMTFRRDLNTANTTLHPRGARVTLFAFGNPVNFDDNLTNGQGNYGLGANGVDAFLFANRRVVHVQAVGNDGASPEDGSDVDPFVPTTPTDTFTTDDIQINDLATAKNIVTVGSNFTDSVDPLLVGFSSDPSEFIANFTSKGPSTFASLRIAPLVVAPGFDFSQNREGIFFDDYFASSAQVVSFDNANDASPVAVESVVVQGEAGTSVSAAKIAGAALQVRDYFAKGFYPTAQATVSDRISDMSGMLVKALLINSTDFASQGPPIANCSGRFCIEEGYGKVELANTLPLAAYRVERRQPNQTNVSPLSNVPQGLLVVDEYFDGGARGASATDGSTTGVGVVRVGGSVSFDFFRRHGDGQLRASLAWYDADGELLRNNLDLEVLSGDSDLVDGGKGICRTLGHSGGRAGVINPDLCSFCTIAGNDPGSGGYFDPTGNNANLLVWRGNQFRQFENQFSLQTSCVAATGVPSTDLASFPQNAFDTRNATESVMLQYLGNPLVPETTTRGGGDHGFYRVRVRFPTGASTAPVPHAPVIAAGPNGVLNTVQVVDDTVETTSDGRMYIGAGANGLANTTAAGDDVQLIPVGSFGQPFALAIAGPVFNVRTGSAISLNRDVYDCSEQTLTARVADGSRILANPGQAETAANVGLNTRIQVLDAGNMLVDQEAGLTFSNDPGETFFNVGRRAHYTSNPRRIQFVDNRPGTPQPITNNGVIEVRDGWTIRAIYDDQSPTNPGGATPEDAQTSARVSCKPFIGPVMLGVVQENFRRTLVAGGCDVGRAQGGRGDFFLDAGEAITYQVGFANQHQAAPVNLKATLACVDPIPGGANPCSSLTIVGPTVELGVVPPGREGIGSWTIVVDQGVKSLASADRAVDLKVTFTSRSTDFGGELATQTFSFHEALQADMDIRRYNTDFPSGATQAVDRNRDGIITTVIPGSTARNRELSTYKPLNDTGTCAGGDGVPGPPNPGSCSNRTASCSVDTDCNNPNLSIAGLMPWHFDTGPVCASNANCQALGGNACVAGQCRDGGFTPFRAADSKPGSPGTFQNNLAWFYSTAGGCGWQTQNNGVVGLSASLPKGIWHAGHGPVGNIGTTGACPAYEPPTDPTTAVNTEFIHDVLQSPVLRKVNSGTDARGFSFDLRMEALGWNEEQSFADSFTQVAIEVDSNLDDDGPVILGDSFTYREPFRDEGPRTGASNFQRTFGPGRDSDGSLLGPGGGPKAPNGEEVGVSTATVTQRKETSFVERALLPYPVLDTDPNVRGLQGNTQIDPGTGLPIIPGVCQGGVCTAGADNLIGTNCVSPGQCTGPGTRLGHTTAWGPARNRDRNDSARETVDFGGSFEDFNGASGNRFQFEFDWFLLEGGDTATGWTLDDVYFEWSEQHPADQDANSPNDCANIPNRPGANPAASQCASVSFERLSLHNCTTGVKVIVTDSTPNFPPAGVCADDPNTPSTETRCLAGVPSLRGSRCSTGAECSCPAGQVALNIQSTQELTGEAVCLPQVSSGVFEGVAQLSALANQKGTLFVDPAAGLEFVIVASYQDPQCDQDSDGEIGENNFLDTDGDATLNFGADAVLGDISTVDFLAEGQGSSDDDNCPVVYNPAGIAQRDNNGSGSVTAADCPAVGQPNGRSPRNGQCDWDDDGVGDLCDNCPILANFNQLDTDTDGVGSACEVVDIDADGVVNADDNCPTLYNPSQAASGQGDGVLCNANSDIDGDNVGEVLDNCPNEGGVLENGVPAPPFSATYNPDQVDTDTDGIGDLCDKEDFDLDGAINSADNCPTFYNPADPVFQVQTDSDLDGFGDDRDGVDLQPGAASYCDPDSADDDIFAGPDDLVGVQSEVNCNFNAVGTANPAHIQSILGSLSISGILLTDDGTADPTCIAGDPDPNNNPQIPQLCPGRTNAECDTPGQPGSGACAPVPDGIADPGELSRVRLTLTNGSSDRRTGAGRALSNLTVGVRSITPSVACIPQAQVFLGSLGAGASVQTPVGALNFIVDPTTPGPGQSTPARLAEAAFVLTAQADDMEGITPQQSFKFFVDSDRIDFPVIAAACPQFPPMNGPGVLCEDFDTNRNGVAGFQFSRLPLSADPNDQLRAIGDPNDDVLGYTQNTGASPIGTDGHDCSADLAFNPPATCDTPVAEENDWHLHHPIDGPGVGYDPLLQPNIGAPDNGKSHSGQRSIHFGRHLDPLSTLGDTTRFRQVSAFVMDPPINIGTGTSMQFWHIIQMMDDDAVGISPGTTFGGGQVQISLLGANGKFEKWQRLIPTFNGFNSNIQNEWATCQFDPGDDQGIPIDETVCNDMPIWSDIGDVRGSDPTCTVDTDGNDPTQKDCGEISSCTGGPGCTEIGTTGLGVWGRSAFDLSPFAGRQARLRFLAANFGGWEWGIDRSNLEPASGQAVQYFEKDDGWWIDDIRLTDLRQSPSIFNSEVETGLSQCTFGQNTNNCGLINIVVDGSSPLALLTDATGRVVISDTLGMPVSLDARRAEAIDNPGTGPVEGACSSGLLLTEWSQIHPVTGATQEVILPFSPAAETQVAPLADSVYRVKVQCSSDTACTAQEDVLVKVYTGDGTDLGVSPVDRLDGLQFPTFTTIGLKARAQPPGMSGYQLYVAKGPGSTGFGTATGPTIDPYVAGTPLTFGGTCLALVPAGTLETVLSVADTSGTPALGKMFMYQVGHHSVVPGTVNPLGIRPTSSNRNGQATFAATGCP